MRFKQVHHWPLIKIYMFIDSNNSNIFKSMYTTKNVDVVLVNPIMKHLVKIRIIKQKIVKTIELFHKP